MQISADNVKAVAYGAAALVAGVAIFKLYKGAAAVVGAVGDVVGGAVDAATAIPRSALKYFTDPAERARVADLYEVTDRESMDDFDGLDGWTPYE